MIQWSPGPVIHRVCVSRSGEGGVLQKRGRHFDFHCNEIVLTSQHRPEGFQSISQPTNKEKREKKKREKLQTIEKNKRLKRLNRKKMKQK